MRKKVFVSITGIESLHVNAQPYALVEANAKPGGGADPYPVRMTDLTRSLDLPVRKAIRLARTNRQPSITFVGSFRSIGDRRSGR